MAVTEAFLAIQNCYFNYEFEELYLDQDFPEEMNVSLRGMLFRHEVKYPDVTHYVYFSDVLMGDELEKMKADFMRYCPAE